MPPASFPPITSPPVSLSKRSVFKFSAGLVVCAASSSVFASNVETNQKIDLTGSLFDKQGKSTGTDPLLLYSIALTESGYGRGKGKIGPWPWTLRAARAHYPETREAAEIKLNELIKSYGRYIDIGLCQANLFWHGHRVKKPEDLLDPVTNLQVANQVLLESIASARGDLELGIGRYHHWTDPARARNYGSRVLAIYRNLKTM